MADTCGGKKPGSLDQLSKKELEAKCKTLLQIAQKAKNARDDAKEENVALQAESEKDRKGLMMKISTLESKIGDTEDVVIAKLRQLDRMSQENDLLLDQMKSN